MLGRGRYNVVGCWRELCADVESSARVHGLPTLGRAVCLLGLLASNSARAQARDRARSQPLARAETRAPLPQLDTRAEYALFASSLCRALCSGSVAHPGRLAAFASVRLRELWPRTSANCAPIFADIAGEMPELLDGLHALSLALVEGTPQRTQSSRGIVS